MANVPLLDLGKPLQLPDPVRQAPVDFRPLNMIGDAVVDYKVKNATAEALAGATGQDGKVNFDLAGANLSRMGLLDQAKPYLDLAMRKAAQDQAAGTAAASLAEQRRFHDITAGQQAADLELRRTANAQSIDPELQKSLAEAKRAPEFHTLAPGQTAFNSKGEQIASNAAGMIDDNTAKMIADQLEQGDDSGLKNLGRGAQGAENVLKIRKTLADRGVTGDAMARATAEFQGIKAANRTSGNQEAKMTSAAIEASGAIKLGLDQVDKVGATRFVPYNKLAQMVDANISDPQLAEFKAANAAIINTYARAISPTGVSTVSAQDHARDILNTAMGPAAWKAAVGQMQREIDMAVESPGKARDHLNKLFQERRDKANGTTTAPATKAEAAPAVPAPVVSEEEAARYGANPTAALAEARDAIAQAPADKKAATKAYAIQKLKLMKIDPKGLD